MYTYRHSSITDFMLSSSFFWTDLRHYHHINEYMFADLCTHIHNEFQTSLNQFDYNNIVFIHFYYLVQS